MRVNPRVLIVSTILVFFCSTSYSQSRTTRRPSPRIISSPVSLNGQIVGSTYQNRFFGVKINIPENWLAQDSTVGNAIKDSGTKAVKGKNAQTQKAFDESIQRLTVLFTVTKDIMGIQNNALMTLSAEKSAPFLQFRNGQDYLRLVIQSFKQLQLPPDFNYSENIEMEKLGNETFYFLNIRRANTRQRFYATTRKGYALFFTLTYGNEQDLETMKNIISNADFAWKE